MLPLMWRGSWSDLTCEVPALGATRLRQVLKEQDSCHLASHCRKASKLSLAKSTRKAGRYRNNDERRWFETASFAPSQFCAFSAQICACRPCSSAMQVKCVRPAACQHESSAACDEDLKQKEGPGSRFLNIVQQSVLFQIFVSQRLWFHWLITVAMWEHQPAAAVNSLDSSDFRRGRWDELLGLSSCWNLRSKALEHRKFYYAPRHLAQILDHCFCGAFLEQSREGNEDRPPEPPHLAMNIKTWKQYACHTLPCFFDSDAHTVWSNKRVWNWLEWCLPHTLNCRKLCA